MSWQRDARSVLDRAIAERRLAGAQAVIWQDGETVFDEAANFRDIANNRALGHDAIFQVASMTKPIVSVAALQLVDEGKVRLDDPIAKWLPEFASPRVLDDPAGPLDRTHAASRAITIDDLLTHRAGFGYCFTESGPIAKALEPLVSNILNPTLGPDQWLAELARLPLISEPGFCFRYGHSTEVLGCLIARIDGRTLGQSMEQRVLGPLGMADTGFHVSSDKLPRLARMYRRGENSFEDVTDVPTAPRLFEAGGGGLYSTAADYLVFARMLLGQGEVDGIHVLSSAMSELMQANHLTEAQRALGGLNQPDFFAGMGFGYGVHLVMEPSPPLHLGAGSMSWGGIWGTAWRVDPVNRLISLFFAQDHADTSSDAERLPPGTPTSAGETQAAIEQIIWSNLAPRSPSTDGWVRLAPRRRSGGRANTSTEPT